MGPFSGDEFNIKNLLKKKMAPIINKIQEAAAAGFGNGAWRLGPKSNGRRRLSLLMGP
jgi:hypothetical protein